MNKQEIYAFLKEKNIWHEIMAYRKSKVSKTAGAARKSRAPVFFGKTGRSIVLLLCDRVFKTDNNS